MSNQRWKGKLYLLGASCLFCSSLFGQVTDTTSYHKLSDVEVIGHRKPSVLKSSAPIQILNNRSFEQLGLQDLSDAVKRFSGVSVQDYGGIGGLKTVSVRSLGAKHTAVSYDGVTITDMQSGQVDISRFSLDDVEMVSLSIGQADDIFQSARVLASAGTLSIQTRSPYLEEDKSFRLQGKIKTGSFGLFNPYMRYEQRLGKTYALSVQGDWTRADGRYPYTFTNGNIVTHEKRKNSDVNSWRTELNLFADWKRNGKLQLKGYWFDSERGLPGAVILYNDWHTERLFNKNGFLQANYENCWLPKLDFKALAKFDYGWTRYQDFHSQYVGGVQTDVYTQREYYASVGWLYRPAEGFSISLAEDFFLNTLDATTPKCPFPTRYSSLTALAAQYKNDRLTATASLLGTYITETLEIGEAAADRKRLSPAASVSWLAWPEQHLRIRASFKDGFRVPTFNDLYYDRIGNRELDAEKASQYNLGFTWNNAFPALSLDFLSLTVDGYYNHVRDKIVAIPTMFIWKMMNQGVVNIFGLDANLAASFALPADMALQLNASYTWQNATDRTDKTSKIYGHQIPYTAEHAGSVSASLENPWVNLGWSLTAVGDRYTLPQNLEDNRIDGYIEQQLSANKTFRIGKCSLRLQAEVVNLGNVTYDVIRYYPMPGRSFRATVQVTY